MSTEFDTELVKDDLRDLKARVRAFKKVLAPLKMDHEGSTLQNHLEGYEPLDKAKLLVTLSYAIDSLLFCYLKTKSVDTDKHTILNELTRIQQYVAKIKDATTKSRTTQLDKEAAQRVLNHDLAGNAALDRERALKTRSANEKLEKKLASISTSTHIKFDVPHSEAPDAQLEDVVPATKPSTIVGGSKKSKTLEKTDSVEGNVVSKRREVMEAKAERRKKDNKKKKAAKLSK